MKITRLSLRHFRNIEHADLEFDSDLISIVGKNGHGKTSVLEAIGYLSTLRSFRGSKNDELVQNQSQFSDIRCNVTSSVEGFEDWETSLRITFEQMDRVRKQAFIDDKPFGSSVKYLSERFGAFRKGFYSISFNPSDHDLVRGEPSERRNYLDRALVAESLENLQLLQSLKKTLEQRNSLLKENRGYGDVFESFTEELARTGSELAWKRLIWISRLGQEISHLREEGFRFIESLEIKMLSNWIPENLMHFSGQLEPPSLELLKELFLEKLSSVRAQEREAKSTLVGPHRDDWMLYWNSNPLKGRGSQGEVRSSLLALKLAEVGLFQEKAGHKPVFLLDDFSSELDRDRRENLLSFLSSRNLQVFITTTEESLLRGQVFEVVEGKFTSRSKLNVHKRESPEIRL